MCRQDSGHVLTADKSASPITDFCLQFLDCAMLNNELYFLVSLVLCFEVSLTHCYDPRACILFTCHQFVPAATQKPTAICNVSPAIQTAVLWLLVYYFVFLRLTLVLRLPER